MRGWDRLGSFQGALAAGFSFMKDFPGAVPGRMTDGLLCAAGRKIPFIFPVPFTAGQQTAEPQAPLHSWVQSHCRQAPKFSLLRIEIVFSQGSALLPKAVALKHTLSLFRGAASEMLQRKPKGSFISGGRQKCLWASCFRTPFLRRLTSFVTFGCATRGDQNPWGRGLQFDKVHTLRVDIKKNSVPVEIFQSSLHFGLPLCNHLELFHLNLVHSLTRKCKLNQNSSLNSHNQ